MEEQPVKPDENRSRGFLSWPNMRDLAVVALVLVISIKLATAEFSVELKEFSFTDLLSMFLAVSAIALSAAFYFKADESARSFYNNTYKFTKDVSEILGRIDAGFGERLKSIDQGYTGLNEKLDRFAHDPNYALVAARASEDIQAKKEEIQEQEARREDIIQDLMRRADVAGAEKEDMLAKLAELSEELARSKAELEKKDNAFKESAVELSGPILSRLTPLILKHYPQKYVNAPFEFINERFKRVMGDPGFGLFTKYNMVKEGLLEDSHLTQLGVSAIRSVLSKAPIDY